jgi:hypothetical protein
VAEHRQGVRADPVSEQLSFYGDGPSLAQARAELMDELDEGTTCPCCGQHAQRYRWSLYSTACWMLIRLYEAGGVTEFVESKRVKRPGDGGSASHLWLWGLVEHEPDRRPDGGKSGWWRVTAAGERFIRGGSIPKYAYVYNGVVERHDGQLVTISDRLGHPFDWNDHMRGQSA